MTQTGRRKRDVEKAAAIIRDAGGRVVGRTRLQKIAYLLELAGLGEGFSFEYRHYGPYSEELAMATEVANLLGLITEEERATSWGGFYSIFTAHLMSDAVKEERKRMAQTAAEADSVVLELAATAAFLASKGAMKPWDETVQRKPEKAASGRIERAKILYEKLRQIETPNALPEI